VNVHQQIARAEVELACGTYMSNGFLLGLACPFRTKPNMVRFITNPYENRHLGLRTYHRDFCFGSRRHTRTGKDIHRQIQNGIRGQGHSHAGIILYTQGADPAILGFYKMMQSGEAGEKISKIELVDLTPEDAKKAAAPQDSPTGGKVCLTLKPVKKLVIKIKRKDANGSSSSTSENFIAEKDGKFVIPVPGPCK
jgi:hypothetical protein